MIHNGFNFRNYCIQFVAGNIRQNIVAKRCRTIQMRDPFMTFIFDRILHGVSVNSGFTKSIFNFIGKIRLA